MGYRKKFVFYEEPTLAFCLVYGLVAVALAHDAFRRPFKSVQEAFSLTVPPDRNVLRLRFKSALLRTPFFRDVELTDMGYRVSDCKAFPYYKYRDQHVHLCRLVGMEQQGELYDLRRGSGRNIYSKFQAALLLLHNPSPTFSDMYPSTYRHTHSRRGRSSHGPSRRYVSTVLSP